jgi:DNA polymerase III alpha subunit
MSFIVSPHTHIESSLSASTLSNFIKYAKSIGRTHLSYTDNGSLSSFLKTYNLAQKEGLKFIPGIEFYFKDPSCPFITGTSADRCKYFSATLFVKDQTSYQELCRLVSKTDFPTIEIFEETQSLWSWKDLEYMAQFDTDLVLGGVHDMVGKCMLSGNAEVGQRIFLRLKEIFGSRLYTSIITETWSKKWNIVIEIKYADGTKDSVLSTDYLSTDRARKIKASEVAEHPSRHTTVKAKYSGGMYSEVNKNIESVKEHKGFLPLPGGDVLGKVNKFLFALSQKYDVNILISDYAYYAQKEDKIVQTMRLEGTNKLQPNFYMKNDVEISDYLTSKMSLSLEQIQLLLLNNEKWAHQYDSFKLEYGWRLAETEGSAIRTIMDIVKDNGRMKWDDPKYVSRLKEEIDVIHRNGVYDLSPYFLPIRDVLNFYKENGYLSGPGRGSSGGSLLCYLMGITHINPFKYDLPFQRFFSMVRIKTKKLPDIDVDLEDRELLVGKDGRSGYLHDRWGDKAAQISTRTTIRLKSAILDTNRYFKGKVEDSISVLSKGLPTPPQGVSDFQFVFGYEDTDENHIPGLIELSEDLKKYSESRPKEWEIVSKAMGLTRAYSKHASAFVISNVPIQDVIPTKAGFITQYEAKETEAAGLIKYDFLVVKQLKDVRVALDLINKKNNNLKSSSGLDLVGWWHPESDSGVCADCDDPEEFVLNCSEPFVGTVAREEVQDFMICEKCGNHFKNAKKGKKETGYFVHNNKSTYIWDLPEVEEVFHSIWNGKTETMFQINTASMRPYVIEMLPQSIMDLATILALVRPGPLDFIDPNTGRNMTQEYMARRCGASEPDIKELGELLSETYGIIVFQEQLTKIAKELAGFSGEDAELLRENMAKKYMVKLMEMKPNFIASAKNKVSESIAESIWERMVTFGRYGFSVIHAVEYAHITYACMFLKHFYPLEWWAAVLTNAEETEITGVLWPFVKDMVLPPDINLSSDVMAVDYNIKKIRSKLNIIRGMGDKTMDPIINNRPYKDIQDFVNKEVAGPSLTHKLIHVGVLDSLFPYTANLLEKLKMYEDAVEVKKYNDKVQTAKEKGKTVKALAPKQGTIPEEYINLHPIKDAAMKKSVLPSLPIDLFYLGSKYSKALVEFCDTPMVISKNGYKTILFTGEKLRRLDNVAGESVMKDVYVACTCFIIEAKEFSYAKNTKKALKLILDCDGYVNEKVMWPEYESGNLVYPQELKKGKIATFFFKKRAGKKDLSVMEIVIES